MIARLASTGVTCCSHVGPFPICKSRRDILTKAAKLLTRYRGFPLFATARAP